MRICVLILSLLFSHALMAEEGTKTSLFVLTKTYNPENFLAVHAYTDKNCKFVSNNGDYLDFYWRMNAGLNNKDLEYPKETNAYIKKKTKERLTFLGINVARDTYRLNLTDLSELRHDLQDRSIEVMAQIQGGKCIARPVIKLGPSAGYRKMSVSRIHCVVSKNMLGAPDGCSKLTISGNDPDTNEKLRDVVFLEK